MQYLTWELKSGRLHAKKMHFRPRYPGWLYGICVDPGFSERGSNFQRGFDLLILTYYPNVPRENEMVSS